MAITLTNTSLNFYLPSVMYKAIHSLGAQKFALPLLRSSRHILNLSRESYYA